MKLELKRYFYLMAGVILMINLFGCSGIKFEKYSSKDPVINISMDYISGWQYDETRGSYNSYAQVMFFPFKEGQKSSRATMVVTVKDSSMMKFTPLTLETVADNLLTKRMQFKDVKLLSRSKMSLLNTEATVIKLSYLTLENLLNVNSKLIPVKESIVVFKKQDKFYIVRYENTEEEFNKFNNAFSHIIKTIKLKSLQ